MKELPPTKQFFSDHLTSIAHPRNTHPYQVSGPHTADSVSRHPDDKQQVLLSVGNVIAALRRRDELLQVVSQLCATLFRVRNFAIALMEESGTTYQLILSEGNVQTNHSGSDDRRSDSLPVEDLVMRKLLQSTDPVLFDIAVLTRCPGVPAYIHAWLQAGDQNVLGWRLWSGGREIGAILLRGTIAPLKEISLSLFKAIFSQIAVAIDNIIAHERLAYYQQLLKGKDETIAPTSVAMDPVSPSDSFPQVIGKSPAMQQVYKLMSMVARADSTVLLLGETGTGKEVIATAIHKASARHDKPMIKVNCAALPANLIESELFGHERGAFTGAAERRIGKFELAHQGTIFLDEIGEIPVEVQVKLLRVLQEREIERVGGKTTIKINVRVIAATNRDLEAEIKAGRFRSDLFYRLHVFPIPLPPLRLRKDDIAPLAAFFLDRYSKATGKKVTGIAANLLQDMEAYQWPGNVRELEHLIERSVLLARDTVLKEIILPPSQTEEVKVPVLEQSLQEMERTYIIQALRKYNGRIGGADGAAHFLDIPATTLHSKIKKLAILKKDYVY